MTPKESDNVVIKWLQNSKNSLSGLSPAVSRIETELGPDMTVQTVAGPLTPMKVMTINSNAVETPQFAYFVDDDPNANWEHPCRYVFVHPSKALSVADRISPPSSKLNYVLTQVAIPKV